MCRESRVGAPDERVEYRYMLYNIVITLYIHCVILQVSKEKIMFYFITLYLYEKNVKYSYDVTFSYSLNDKT